MFELSYTDLRANLASVWDRLTSDRETVILHRRGHEDLAMLPASEYRGLLETVHLLRSPRNAARLLDALSEAVDNKAEPLSLDELRTATGLTDSS